MMVMYLLQHVYKTPLNYKFSLYTYGPYDEAVLNCIDSAERNKLIKLEQHVGSNNSYGYHIHAICEDKVVDVDLDYSINDVAEKFDGCRARDWELVAIIVYVYAAYKRNNLLIDKSVMCMRINSLKPHFKC
ncbi:MAG: hypothetical protein FWH37_06055 [Candidatus Bathyarchaeota archaeon]|nr:hypothetical protein [Candidatus Termiticorpusculum sp.]